MTACSELNVSGRTHENVLKTMNRPRLCFCVCMRSRLIALVQQHGRRTAPTFLNSRMNCAYKRGPSSVHGAAAFDTERTTQ